MERRAASATMRLLWLLLASSYHACADPELVEAAIRRMEERGQHDLVEDVRRRLAEQEGKEDEFEQHYAAAVHLQRRPRPPRPLHNKQPGADPQTAALMAQIRAQEATKQQQLPDAGDVLAKIRAFEANNRKPQRRPRGARRVFWSEKAQGPSQGSVEVGHDAAALMAKIRQQEAQKGGVAARRRGSAHGQDPRGRGEERCAAGMMPGGDDAAALMKAIRQQEAQSRVTGAAPDAAALMKEMQAFSEAATPAGGAARSGAPKASGGGGVGDEKGREERRRRAP